MRSGKRYRGNDNYSETDKFEQLKNMLETWKTEQNIIFYKLISEVSELKQQSVAIWNTNLEIEESEDNTCTTWFRQKTFYMYQSYDLRGSFV